MLEPSTTGHDDSSSLTATPTATANKNRAAGRSCAKKKHGLPISGKKHKTPKA